MDDVGRLARQALAVALVVGGMLWGLTGDASSASLGKVRPGSLFSERAPVSLTRAIVYETFDGTSASLDGRWPLMHAGSPWTGGGWRTNGAGAAVAATTATSRASIQAKRARVRVTARLVLPVAKREIGVVLNEDATGVGVVVWHTQQGNGRVSIGQIRPTRIDTWAQQNTASKPASATLIVDFDVVPCTYRVWFNSTNPVLTYTTTAAVCAASRAATRFGLYADADTASSVDQLLIEAR